MAGKSAHDLRAENQRLNAQVDELRLRLEEAEQALEAIRTGQAESVIVDGPSGPRIFSLEGADHSYRVLVEAMNEGATTFAEDGTILYCNARFASMLGAPLESVMGSPIMRYLPGRSHAAFHALLREANTSESRGELDLMGPDGNPVPALLSISVIEDETRCRYCLVAADLREQKRNEEILTAERLAGSVLDQAADAVIVCDENGRIMRASGSAATLCTCNPLLMTFERAFPLTLSDPPGGSPRDLLARALRGEDVRTLPASMTLPDQSQAQLLVSAVALHDPEKRHLGYVVTIVNISELRAGEELLRESERRYKSLAENMPAVLMRYGPDLRVRYLSPSAEQITGRPASDFIGRTNREMGMPEHLCNLWEETIAEVFHSNESREIEFSYPDCDRHFVLKLVPECGPDRRVETVLGISTDITERKRTEEALRAANLKLADADQRKNQFLAVLSHELRNPLAPIKNSLYILERAVPGGDQARRAQDVIDRQIAQLARLVDDLLDVTRITRNKVQLQRQRLELNELVRRSSSTMAGSTSR